MLRAIYRAIIIGRAKSAANYVARNLSDRQLNDIGHSRSTIISASVQSVIRDLDEADKRRDQKAIKPSSAWSLPGIWSAYMRRSSV